jgi:hypothetical protein
MRLGDESQEKGYEVDILPDRKSLAGRPPKSIDWNLVEQYLLEGSSGQEIAQIFGIHADTLYDRCQKDFGINFSELSQTNYQKGNQIIRNKQLEVATNGNTSMLIWLGKQRLGQREQFPETANQLIFNVQVNEMPK